MDNWLLFILERYNYWIVITLMMTGLYTVFARGNLVKKIVGLNLFQTSVFIFYITIGKITGGTAPIYIGGELDHGGGHEETPIHDAETSVHEMSEKTGEGAAALHSKIDNTHANELKDAIKQAPAEAHGDTLHDAPNHLDSAKISNEVLSSADKHAQSQGFDIAAEHGADAGHGVAEAGHAGADGLHHATEIIYSNPLPHVLILTAIVVGVATTAVGLALAVRIREAYGTIEEDELEAADDIAEFGETEGVAA
ncbi:sodium:proton antiporter [Hyphococcus sp. DH-69]|uniref:sodium:proton antiporter n=1 Tax=Hyphococcus formosus TaxID=3143534 RepID=UPI00398A8B16